MTEFLSLKLVTLFNHTMLRKIQVAESAKSHKHAKLIAEASQTLEDAVAAADLQLLGPVLEGV